MRSKWLVWDDRLVSLDDDFDRVAKKRDIVGVRELYYSPKYGFLLRSCDFGFFEQFILLDPEGVLGWIQQDNVRISDELADLLNSKLK